MSGLIDSACLSHFGGLTSICFINVPNLISLSGLDGCCPGECGTVVSRHVNCLAAVFALWHCPVPYIENQCPTGVAGMFSKESQVVMLACCQVSPTEVLHVVVDPFTGLESLNITECGLETTEGLEGLTGLTALHLSSNHLQSLDGVRGMTRLKKLWANDNRIKTVRKRRRGNDMPKLRAPRRSRPRGYERNAESRVNAQ